MDPFRLLSRSTNLQKSSSPRGVSVQKIPSAADSGHIETNTAAHGDDEEDFSKGEKRKRLTRNYTLDSPALQPQNDNINSSILTVPSGPGSAFGAPISISRQITLSRETAESDDDLGRDEWRRVLKQNRVKVTLLDPGLHSEDGRKERHKRLSRRNGETFDRTKKSHTQLTPRPLRLFDHLTNGYDVSKRLGLNLKAQGYTMPTEVQLGAIPLLLGTDYDRGLHTDDKKGRRDRRRSEVDLLTVAPTGSGKTLAFLIHLLHGLRQIRREQETNVESTTGSGSPQAIILAPTHELVDQTINEGKKLAIGTGIRISRLRKGMMLGSGKKDMLESLAESYADDQPAKPAKIKADILVSTPMLLLHAITQSRGTTMTSLNNVRYLVLDEADVLLDPLFRTQTLEIWNLCTSASLQTSLWSATIGSSIEDLAQNFILDRRRRLGLDVGKPKHHIVRLVVGVKDSANSNIAHRLMYAATEQGKLMALRQMIHPSSTTVSNGPPLQPPFLVFTQTIPRAVALHSELLYEIPPEAGGSSRIAVLHSDLSDSTRAAIMAGFRKGEIWILITTDLLARGVDFRGINGVVNYDIPNTRGIYIHRVGRTGRQGREGGVAVTLYTKEDIKYVKNVANVIAASEKQKAKLPGAKGEDGLQDWLLNALPDVSKKAKRELKRHGVEARRTSAKSKDGGREAKRMRISTKSGYDRSLEQKKKQAFAASRGNLSGGGADEEWDGIED